MNRKGFIDEIVIKLNCDKERAIEIANVLEEHSLFGRNNRKKTINALMNDLNISYEEADNIYNVCCSIAANEIKNKIFHPFKKVD